MPRLAPVTRTALPTIVVMVTVSFLSHLVIQAGRGGVVRFGRMAVLPRDLRDLVGSFGYLERWDGTVEAGGAPRAADKQSGRDREGEQGDRSANPQGQVEAVGQRDVDGLALTEQGAQAGGGDRGGDRDTERPAELLGGVDQPRGQPGLLLGDAGQPADRHRDEGEGGAGPGDEQRP